MGDALLGRWVRRAVLPIVMGLWLTALIFGIRSLQSYEITAGRAGASPEAWPAQVFAADDVRLPTLVVALHPRCSCSKATLTELEEAAEGFDHPYNAVLLIYRPRGEEYKWQDVSLYREAQRQLHARVVLDDNGELAAKFGAFTSGEVLYYSAAEQGKVRRLLFSGGVTGGRGMVGENAGIEALKRAVNGPMPVYPAGRTNLWTPVLSPVYGCGFSALSRASRNLATP